MGPVLRNETVATMKAVYCAPVWKVISVLLFLAATPGDSQLSDKERNRRQEYQKRGYTWPIPEYVPSTAGWRELFDRRFRQIAEIPNEGDRFEAYASAVTAALLQPNFTEFGFGLARAPEDLMVDLRQAIHEGVAEGPNEEGPIAIIEDESPQPWFIERPDLTERVRRTVWWNDILLSCVGF